MVSNNVEEKEVIPVTWSWYHHSKFHFIGMLIVVGAVLAACFFFVPSFSFTYAHSTMSACSFVEICMVVKYALSLLSTYKKTGSHGKSIKAEEKNLPHATKDKSGDKKKRNKKRANKDNTNCPSNVHNGLAMFIKGYCVRRGTLSWMGALLLLLIPSTLAGTCDLPQDYSKYFIAALNDIEETAIAKITDGLEDIGIGPLGSSLPVPSLLDLKHDVFEVVFGNETERALWFSSFTTDVLDIGSRLESNAKDLIGGELTLDCEYNETEQLFSVSVNIASPALNWDISDLPPADVTFLPQPFPPLDVSTATVMLAYDLNVPLALSLKLKKFFLGEVTASLSAAFEAEVSKSLPILPSNNVTFEGNVNLEASFAYSSISEWKLEGTFDASLEASTSGSDVGVASLGVRAFDDNIFDTKPRTFVSTDITFYS